MTLPAHCTTNAHDGWYIGLMSGTSLDGVDAVLARFAPRAAQTAQAGLQSGALGAVAVQVGGHVHQPFEASLREALMALNFPGQDELHQAAMAANALAQCCVQAVERLCQQAGIAARQVAAIGAHGQTVRHRPQGVPLQRYTIQLNNPAWLAEHTGISVVADFRRRDMAAGGQGAPLAPAFHQALFGPAEGGGAGLAVLNLGGIANLSLIDAQGQTLGFDCGPANTLLDAWCLRHTGQPYDRDGQWAASGQVHEGLLRCMLAQPYFQQPAPKSTGLDVFNLDWLQQCLAQCAQVEGDAGGAAPALRPEDVQASLAELTAISCAQAYARYQQGQPVLGVCGGGAYNRHVMARLQHHLGAAVAVQSTAQWGLAPELVEACAFAWLARQCLLGLPGNLPAVTQAAGPRILGAIYPC